MASSAFFYQLNKRTVVFTDTLTKNAPYIARKPRDHESLFLVTNGTLIYEKEGKKEIVRTGAVGYVARGSLDKSAAYECDSVSYISFNFSHDTEVLTPSLPFPTECSLDTSRQYERLFTEAYACFLRKAPGYLAVCNGLLLQIIGLLYSEQPRDRQKSKKTEQMATAVAYLEENYVSPELTVARLAEIAGLGEKQFRRSFFSLYGKTPFHYLQEFRMDKAKILLSYTQKSITEIALQCGFSDVYSFSHCFKKHHGLSPLQYKEQI